AIKRLESVEKQLLRNPIRAEVYKSSINQYHERGFAEEVKDTKAHDNDIKLFPEAAKRVMDDMYVDDCLTGADDKEEAVKLQKELTEFMHCAAFNLTKWSSNTEDVLSHVEEKDRARNMLIDFREREPLKALGICWNTLTDCFEFHIPQNQFLLHECETKRNMLSDASKIFDPMGLLSPYTIRSKMLFQQLWNRGLQWDEQLPEDILQQWNAWKTEDSTDMGSAEMEALSRGGKSRRFTDSWSNIEKSERQRFVETWPNQKLNQASTRDAQKERKAKPVQNFVTVSNKPVIDHGRYERWIKLIRVTAYVLRFVANLKLKKHDFPKELSVDEIANAETFLYHHIQKEAFPEEYERLASGKTLQRNSRILKLDPYFDKNSHTLRLGQAKMLTMYRSIKLDIDGDRIHRSESERRVVMKGYIRAKCAPLDLEARLIIALSTDDLNFPSQSKYRGDMPRSLVLQNFVRCDEEDGCYPMASFTYQQLTQSLTQTLLSTQPFGTTTMNNDLLYYLKSFVSQRLLFMKRSTLPGHPKGFAMIQFIQELQIIKTMNAYFMQIRQLFHYVQRFTTQRTPYNFSQRKLFMFNEKRSIRKWERHWYIAQLLQSKKGPKNPEVRCLLPSESQLFELDHHHWGHCHFFLICKFWRYSHIGSTELSRWWQYNFRFQHIC
ncbi:Hypothetical predicted protein, partial [Paramuricea clavata]